MALGDRGPMTFAGLWDLWQPPEGKPLKSFTIITTRANDLLASLHGRMPVLLPPERRAAWLGEHRPGEMPATDGELKAMLKPYSGSAMAFWPVDRRVGNVKNDSPDLFTPVNHEI